MTRRSSANRLICLAAGLGLTLLAGAAQADPCEAIPEGGPLPDYLGLGATFSGPVVHVIDGDSLCIAVGPRASVDWVEVRLSDFYAPEFKSPTGPVAKAALERVAAGRLSTCVANLRTYDRIAARCRIEGQSIGDLMRAAGIKEGGNGIAASGPQSAYRGQGPSGRTPAPAGLSCAEIRARGGARQGDPGYRPEWDGDHDGIACEPYRR